MQADPEMGDAPKAKRTPKADDPWGNPKEETKHEPYEMKGGSVLDYADLPIDNEATLLGDRYLCRGGSMFIVAPSGQGKSTLSIQLAAEWALGWSPLGLSSHNRSLRTLVIQSEDDAGDVTEMARWIRKEGLFSDEQLDLIAMNTHIEPINDAVGENFLAKLDSCLEQFGPDIVIINPYTAYLGGDVKDEELANRFLREGLTPLLTEYKCAAIVLHHTPKTQFSKSDDFTTADFMYRGSGCASMTNWARAYLVFEPVPDNESTFRFVAAKRGKRIGWDSFVRYFKHSDNGELRWIPCSTEEATALEAEKKAKSNRTITLDPEVILKHVPMLDAERFDVVARRISTALNIGQNRAEKELNILEGQGKVFYGFLTGQNPGFKGGRPARIVKKMPFNEDDMQAG
jgi:hypothetical protein